MIKKETIVNKQVQKNTSHIKDFVIGEFAWTWPQQEKEPIKVFILSELLDGFTVKVLIGDITREISASRLFPDKESARKFFFPYKKQLVNSLQETYDREIIEALSKKLIK